MQPHYSLLELKISIAGEKLAMTAHSFSTAIPFMDLTKSKTL